MGPGSSSGGLSPLNWAGDECNTNEAPLLSFPGERAHVPQYHGYRSFLPPATDPEGPKSFFQAGFFTNAGRQQAPPPLLPRKHPIPLPALINEKITINPLLGRGEPPLLIWSLTKPSVSAEFPEQYGRAKELLCLPATNPKVTSCTIWSPCLDRPFVVHASGTPYVTVKDVLTASNQAYTRQRNLRAMGCTGSCRDALGIMPMPKAAPIGSFQKEASLSGSGGCARCYRMTVAVSVEEEGDDEDDEKAMKSTSGTGGSWRWGGLKTSPKDASTFVLRVE